MSTILMFTAIILAFNNQAGAAVIFAILAIISDRPRE